MDILFYFIGLVPLCFPISIPAPTNTNISIWGFRENLVQIFFFHGIHSERRLAIRSLSTKNFQKNTSQFLLYPYKFIFTICKNVELGIYLQVQTIIKKFHKYSQDSSFITLKCHYFHGMHTVQFELSLEIILYLVLKIQLKLKSLFSRALIDLKLKFPTASL